LRAQQCPTTTEIDPNGTFARVAAAGANQLAQPARAKRKPLMETKPVVQHPDPALNRIGDENLMLWQRASLFVQGE
jgi:hypothetical protein